jgi:ankyrin repeat protein
MESHELVNAIRRDSKQEVIDLLKTTDIHIYKQGLQPLTDLCPKRDVFELLVDAGLNVNTRTSGGGTVLHEYAWRGSDYSAEVRFALSHGAAVSLTVRGEWGRTPLEVSMLHKFCESTLALLRQAEEKYGRVIYEDEDSQYPL